VGTQTEELEVLTSVARRLESAGIPYMVTGSMAATDSTVLRMTRDIDIVVEVSARDAVGMIALALYREVAG
jgi:hypothetical protein